jgi:hypothetical protein
MRRKGGGRRKEKVTYVTESDSTSVDLSGKR